MEEVPVVRENSDNAMDKAQGPMYGAEHSLAWLMAVAAIVLGVIGLLVGFNVLDFRTGEAGIQIGGDTGETAIPGNFLDGAMWLFSGITAAILAFTLHSTDHHRMRNPSSVAKSDRAMLSAEHMGAYLTAILAIALVVIGMLVGYGVFDVANPQLNALMWIWGGFGSGILAATLHTVRHHVSETDEIVAIVTERVRVGGEPMVGERQTRPTR